MAKIEIRKWRQVEHIVSEIAIVVGLAVSTISLSIAFVIWVLFQYGR